MIREKRLERRRRKRMEEAEKEAERESGDRAGNGDRSEISERLHPRERHPNNPDARRLNETEEDENSEMSPENLSAIAETEKHKRRRRRKKKADVNANGTEKKQDQEEEQHVEFHHDKTTPVSNIPSPMDNSPSSPPPMQPLTPHPMVYMASRRALPLSRAMSQTPTESPEDFRNNFPSSQRSEHLYRITNKLKTSSFNELYDIFSNI